MGEPFVLPRRVQVGPFLYEIGRAVMAPDRWGSCDNDERKLKFAETTKGQQLANTVIHEFIHAVESVWAVKITEGEVERMANGLTQALQSAGLLPEQIVLEGDDAS